MPYRRLEVRLFLSLEFDVAALTPIKMGVALQRHDACVLSRLAAWRTSWTT